MNIKSNPKLLTFASFIAILILAFILIGVFHNQTESTPSAGIYLLVSGIVAMSVVMMLQVMKVTAKTISTDDYLQKSYAATEEDIQPGETLKNDQAGEDHTSLDPAVYEKKILPQSSKKPDLNKFTESVLSNIAKEFDAVQGLFYVREKDKDTFSVMAKYAYFGEEEPKGFELGISLTGQTAKNQKALSLAKIPENYITILSGLGSSSPNSLLFVPVIHEGQTIGLIELASFRNFDKKTERLFNELSESLGKKLSEVL